MPYKDKTNQAKASRKHYLSHKEKVKEASKERRARLVNYVLDIKKKSICIDCGNKDYRVFDFHHIEDKLFNISDGARAGYSIKVINKELKKCIVLCSNCHRIRHWKIKEK